MEKKKSLVKIARILYIVGLVVFFPSFVLHIKAGFGENEAIANITLVTLFISLLLIAISLILFIVLFIIWLTKRIRESCLKKEYRKK